MSLSLRAVALISGLAACALPAVSQAHHSFAMFDTTKTVTIKGVVKELQWTNPHVILWVYAQTSAAPAELWSVELTSPGNLTRQGWTRQSFKAGDHVSVDINPLRDGEHGGGFKAVTNLDGGQIFGVNRAG